MKASIKILLTFIFLSTFFCLHGVGQTITVSPLSINLNACGTPDSVIMTIDHPGSVDSLKVRIPFIQELELSPSVNASSGNVVALMNGDTLEMTLDSTVSFPVSITLPVQATCEAIDNDTSNQVSGYTVTQAVSVDFYNGSTLSSSFDVQVYSPHLEFSQLIEPPSVLVGEVVGKTIQIKNTSPTVFSGDFRMQVAVGNHLSLVALSSSSNSLTNVSLTLTDSLAILTGTLNNFLGGDSLIFEDSVFVTGCNIDSAKTYYQFTFGCDSTNLCQSISIPNSTLAPATIIPSIRRLPVQGETLCYLEEDSMNLTIPLTNIGTTTAFDFKIVLSTLNGRFEVDPNHVFVTKNGDTLDIFNKPGDTLILWNNPTLCIDGMLHTGITVIPMFEPGDTILLNFKATMCCANSTPRTLYPEFSFSSLNLCTGGRINHGYSLTRNSYGQTQLFENFTSNIQPGNTSGNIPPTTRSSDSLNFSISNISNTFQFYNVMYLDSLIRGGAALFEVEILLDSGLRYVDSTLHMKEIPGASFPYTWHPISVDKRLGASTDPLGGYGDTLYARFALPADFYFFERGINLVYPHVSFYDSLNRYLSNSNVNFQLQGICPAKSPVSTITQNMFFIPDTNCNSSCRLQISTVSDQVNIMCPGCLTPGYLTSRFDLNRINFGRQDDDNNHWPDSLHHVSATDSLLNSKRAVLGDTMAYSLESSLWPGQSVTLGTLGFALKNTVVELNLPAVLSLEGDVEINLTDANGAQHIFLYPLDSIELAGNQYSINLQLDSLKSWGLVTDPSFIQYEANDRVEVDGKVVVTSNITANIPIQVEEAVARVYATDVWSDQSTLDAGDAFAQDPNSLDSTMQYICESWNARFSHLKILTPALYQISHVDLGHVYVNSYNCKINYTTIKSFATPLVGYRFRDDFPYEFRTFLSIDSIEVEKPVGFKLKDIRMTMRYPDYNTALAYYYHSTAPLTGYNTPINGAYIFHPQNHIKDSTAYPDLTTSSYVQNDDSVLQGDEDQFAYINVFQLVPERCNEVAGDTVTIISNVVFDQFPGQSPGFNVRDTFEILYPEMTLIPYKLSPDTSIVVDSSFSLRTRITNFSTDQQEYAQGPAHYYGTLPYCFVKVVSPSGNITITEVLNTNGFPFPDTTVSGMYELGSLGRDGFKDFDIIGRLDCSLDSLSEIDSILVINGWNCAGYPDTLEHACFLDTTIYYFQPTPVGLEAILAVDSLANVCDPIHYSLTLDPKGSGKMYKMLAELVLPATNTLNYIPNSGVITWPTTVAGTSIEPVNGLSWILDTLSTLRQDGYTFFDGPMVLEFALQPQCGFANEEIAMQITAYTYCDELISTVVTGRPQQLTGIPTAIDTLQITSLDAQFTGCGDSSLITIVYQNSGSSIFGDSSLIDITLPNSLNITLMDSAHSIIGNHYRYLAQPGMLPGNSDSVRVFVIASDSNSCVLDSVTATALSFSSYSCSGSACLNFHQMDSASLQSPNSPDFNTTCSGFHTFDFQALNFADSCGFPGTGWEWEWDFGHPASGTPNRDSTENPTHAFPGPGNFPVRLITTNPCGRIDSMAHTVSVTGCVLSTEGIQLAGEYMDDWTKLFWEVEPQVEVGLHSYRLDRSQDGETFTEIGNVNAIGAPTYQWEDWALPEGATTLFYRLRLLDFNGTEQFGGIVQIRRVPAFSVFPNPVEQDASFEVTFELSKKGKTRFELVDALGRSVWIREMELNTGSHQISHQPTSAGKGIFFLKVSGPGLQEKWPLWIY